MMAATAPTDSSRASLSCVRLSTVALRSPDLEPAFPPARLHTSPRAMPSLPSLATTTGSVARSAPSRASRASPSRAERPFPSRSRARPRALVARAASASADRYAAWLRDRDVRGDALDVAYVTGAADAAESHRGCVATRDVRAEDALVTLPRGAALYVTEGQENPLGDFGSDELWEAIGEEKWALRVALVLLRERALGEKSEFAAYVAQLPKEYALVGSYSEEDVRAMQYPPAEKMAREQRDENAEAIRLVRKHAASGGALAGMSDEDVVWALDTVRSRVFSGRMADDAKLRAKLLPRSLAVGMCFATFLTAPSVEGRWLAVFAVLALTVFDSTSNSDRDSNTAYVLMPLIDAINHKTMLKTEFEFSGGSFVLRAPRDYKRGEEVFISYGVLNNDELITRYGFVDADNVADVYRFEGFLPFLQANHEPMKRALGADPNRLATIKRTHPELDEALWNGNFISDGNAEDKLLWALRAALATPEEFAAANGVDGFKLGGGAPDRRAADAVRAAVAARLDACPTTLERDAEELAATNGPRKTAIAFRIRKKRILRDACAIYDTSK